MPAKILIANRGEIAVRIIKACQEMGLLTVAVYSEADAQAMHTHLADEAVLLGPPSPTESYLRGDKIIEIAQQTNCQAIHPGFGFLAENADFAERVSQAGLIFVGPSAEAIRQMGSKTGARAVMAQAGVPIVPGYQDSQQDDDLLRAATEIGFPLLVKASAGGGGKGMRLVNTAADMADSLAAARREAKHAFGDDTVYLEKYVQRPHHIEFQIFGDGQGNVIHLFERECSIQRRHQKIIEETPSPLLDDDLRNRMGQAAVAAAQAVNYANAGTLEFLVDGASRDFYFLEMNTRLQVEHPITEMVTGVDLVKWQLQTALWESALPLTPSQWEREQASPLLGGLDAVNIQPRGHAIECRIYAEDPAEGFLPSTGKLLQVIMPTGLHIRVDSGIRSGDEITVHYDPMLAKLIVWAASRAEAIAKMGWALQNTVILGEVTTNIPFLLDVLSHEAFQAGDTPTSFLETHLPDWQPPADLPHEALIALALLEGKTPSGTTAAPPADGFTSDPYSPWTTLRGFRIGSY